MHIWKLYWCICVLASRTLWLCWIYASRLLASVCSHRRFVSSSHLGKLIGRFDALSVSSTFIHENILNSDGKIGSVSRSRSGQSPCDLLTTAQISLLLLFAIKNQSHFSIFFFFSFVQIGYRLIFASRVRQTHMHILI